MLKKIMFRGFFRLLGLLRKRIVVYFIGGVGHAASEVFIMVSLAFVMRDLINGVIQSDWALVSQSILMIVAVAVITSITFLIFGNMFFMSMTRCLNELRLKIFRKVSDFPVGFIDQKHSGDIMSRLNNDLEAVEAVFGWDFRQLLFILMIGCVSAGAMFMLHWKISLVLVISSLLTAFINMWFAVHIRRINDKIQARLGKLYTVLVDIVTGFKIIKIYNMEKYISENYDGNNTLIRKKTVSRSMKQSLLDSINFLVNWFNFSGILIIGAYLLMKDDLSYGVAVALMQLLGGVNIMFREIGYIVGKLQKSLAGGSRVFEILDAETEPLTYDMDIIPDPDFAVEMKDVSFSYTEGRKIIHDLNLAVPRGQSAAIVGLSGSGKTTLFKLLLGFFRPETGGIAVNGKSLSQYTLHELREVVSYVQQDCFLFGGTISDNIRYGKIDANEQEIIHAATSANAHEFIRELPDMYETVVGERGATLSGGQRQRLAIARAILGNSPILLLDEATSALDSDNEQLIQSAINEIIKDKTSIIIAHRLSTVKHVDTIYVMDAGTIVESGDHEELLAKEGKYSELYKKQSAEHKELVNY